ncbi:uracil-DNA glycosylase [Humisphaera borealis]|uniref:Uracil-DNA glycosylase n=1 Tax=Humisphaera borealis TaxID=2807512 RepID=A0A7M2WSU8_9BACT|nr:uracil-DNA glycosylase [Humisphaera borealis]QOV88354.1 uracil-DNA glycosylase [Humisphaera borealis]
MFPSLPESWHRIVGEDWRSTSFDPLRTFIAEEYSSQTVYPPTAQIFSALELTPPEAVKAVILGQDPYHGEGQAHGLAFSVLPGVRPPASLGNIFKELKTDVGVAAPPGVGDLTPWAKQGVLLLNTILTVRQATPLSHKGRGWEGFTDAVLRAVSGGEQRGVFVLWGATAQKKRDLIDRSRHVIIESAHPSPLSARTGFFSSKPFSRINEALVGFGREAIDWRL